MQLAALALCWKGLEEYTSKVGLYSPFEDLKHKLAQNYIILAEVLKSKYQKLTRVLNLKI
jgi:hypothetical protein